MWKFLESGKAKNSGALSLTSSHYFISGTETRHAYESQRKSQAKKLVIFARE
jgi:hypothetical protein